MTIIKKAFIATSALVLISTVYAKNIQPTVVNSDCNPKANCEMVDSIPASYDFKKPVINATKVYQEEQLKKKQNSLAGR